MIGKVNDHRFFLLLLLRCVDDVVSSSPINNLIIKKKRSLSKVWTTKKLVLETPLIIGRIEQSKTGESFGAIHQRRIAVPHTHFEFQAHAQPHTTTDAKDL